MALSVATGSNFIVLLIAIAFHRKLLAPPIPSPLFARPSRGLSRNL